MAVVSPPGNAVRDTNKTPPSTWSGAMADVLHKPVTPVLYIEKTPFGGVFELADRVAWGHLDIKHNGGDTTLTIAASTDVADLGPAGELGTRHLTHLLDQFHPDKRIMLREPEPGRRVLFEGYIQSSGAGWSRRSQGASAVAQDRLEVWLGEAYECQVYGQWLRRDPASDFVETNPDLRLVPALPLHFNPQGSPNRLRGGVAFAVGDGERIVDVFVDVHHYDAQHWTIAQALGYLMHFYVVAPNRVPLDLAKFWDDQQVIRQLARHVGDPDRLRRRMRARMPDMRLDGVSVREALVTIGEVAGLHVRFPIEQGEDDDGDETWSHALRISVRGKAGVADPPWKMRTPAIVDLPREAPHTAVDDRDAKAVAQGNVVEQIDLTFDHRAVNGLIVLGGVEYYEVTLGLVPGWLPFKLIDQGDGPAYVHYPGLLNPPTFDVLDDVATEGIGEARAWWDPLVENDESADNPKAPAHPLHGANVRTNPTLHDIGRLWIFPSDTRRAKLDFEDVSAWQRDAHYYHDKLDCEALDLAEFGGTGLYRLGLPTPGGGLAVATDWVSRARRLRDVSSEMGTGSVHRPPVVDVSWDSGVNWQRVATEVAFLEHECGIRFLVDNLATIAPPPEDLTDDNLIYAIIEGRLRVRVTCLIAGDDRLISERGARTSLKRRRTEQIIDVGEKFKLRDLEQGNSAYRVGPRLEDWQFRTIDEGESLSEFADVQIDQLSGETVSGNPDIPWLELGIEPGDLITGIRGIGIEFPTAAEVAGVRLTREGLKTTLYLTDYRHDADVEQGAMA